MRFAIDPLPRFIFTTNTAKFRLFTWVFSPTLPDHAGIVFARSDDYFFGVLHSSIHELWALRMGTQLEDRPRYTPTTCFETFPLPWAPGREPAIADSPRSGANRAATVRERSPLGRGKTVASSHTPGTVPVPAANTGSRVEIPGKFQRATPTRSPLPDGRGSVLRARIGDAARELNEQRERWLNPPEWIDPIARAIDSTDDFADVPAEAQPLIRQSAIMAAAAKDARLKKRTLTNLYNERPTWLKLAHEKLDRAVLAAYAAVDPEGQWSEDWAEVWVETGAGQPLLEDHPLAARRVEIDPRVLANLLRMNLTRAESGS
ncbi:MAG TPA: type IIL restriction-modification enzyme MmeI [Phycisphaerae bacterium]|nr:type IIL restriction-modification enzyme MmeI [Phycisphaerae bacterium]